ncbi:CRISPR system Cascade subunit CasE [Geobacter sp. OR-1]|uniref:type I-E CRISPR-associated protein Cas6/Cse3/CasE n=1 Tax=Geobacter sp. OR-1 TaxID=1266765 RepID=UPI0005427340|nr:type I-E CRISPR-associated protein Cas6/Cse3/CasE [Geobacter sp. OR-1]GAM10682.1 CRISPR system Cascade subunit CasE [Geobacter sp. OR-1]
MYLSKVMISGTACRNPYEIHRALWKLFHEDAEAERDFLFRVGQSERNSAEVLLQSFRKPEISVETARILGCKEYPLTLQEGQRLRFLLVANPIKMINDEGGRKNASGEPKKCRVPLVKEEDQRAWIERKFLDVAQLENLVIDPVFPLRFRKSKEDRAGKIQQVSFQGALSVQNPESMISLIKTGIGPAKAFGCGLLSLSRA